MKPDVNQERRQAYRGAGRDLARPIVADLGAKLAGAHPEARIEAFRTVIRAAAQGAVVDGGEARAAGILAAALEDIVPAWTPSDLKAAAHARAERALVDAMKGCADER